MEHLERAREMRQDLVRHIRDINFMYRDDFQVTGITVSRSSKGAGWMKCDIKYITNGSQAVAHIETNDLRQWFQEFVDNSAKSLRAARDKQEMEKRAKSDTSGLPTSPDGEAEGDGLPF
jgi:hypothetical protein